LTKTVFDRNSCVIRTRRYNTVMSEFGTNLTPLSQDRAVLSKDAPAARPARFRQFRQELEETMVPIPPGRERTLTRQQHNQPSRRQDSGLLFAEPWPSRVECLSSPAGRKSSNSNSPTFWRTAERLALSGPARPDRPAARPTRLAPAPTTVPTLAGAGKRPSATLGNRPSIDEPRPRLAVAGVVSGAANHPSVTTKSRPRLDAILRQEMKTTPGLFAVLRLTTTCVSDTESRVPDSVTERVTTFCK